MNNLPLPHGSLVPPAEQAGHPPAYALRLGVVITLAAEAAVVGVLGLAVRLPGLGHEPWGDELYHILAARQYLETGTFGINGGVYDRSLLYSEMVAALYRVFGVAPIVARLPALIAAVLTIVALFLWIRRSGERLAAWVAALILILTPSLIEQAQYARFYPFQHLFLLLAAVTASELLLPAHRSVRHTATLSTASALSVAAAIYFQTLSVIGAAGLAAGATLLARPGLLAPLPRGRRLFLVISASVILGASAAAIGGLSFMKWMLTLATYTDLWAEGSRDEVRFYHWVMLNDYPTAWTLFPVVGLLALDRQPRIATLGLSVFTVGFVAHTLLAWKAARYISYMLPFFALLVGLAAAQAFPLVRQMLHRLIPGLSRAAKLARGAAGVTMIGFLLASNSAFVQAARIVTRDQSVLYPGGSMPTLSWQLAVPTLTPLVTKVDAVVSTEDLEAIWFFNRLEYVLDRDHLLQGTASPEFAMDHRIMAMMIGSTSSLRRVIACHPTGLLIAMRWALDSYKMAPDTAAFIREKLQQVPLPDRSGLVAFRWDSRLNVEAAPCPSFPNP